MTSPGPEGKQCAARKNAAPHGAARAIVQEYQAILQKLALAALAAGPGIAKRHNQ
jgi:hypothetical protein